jgi:eukaryotic-like serine/threonine-protein kinase
VFQVGNVIGGRFRVDALLGAGGMGVVAAATHLELGHRVAIKVLREELAENPTIVERFIREARAVVSLKTEHVCRVFDVGRLDSGAPYIVMELLEGADLQRAIAKRPLPTATAVDYVLQACVGLAEAHAAGIVHRDLKPANLFVTRRLDGGPLVKVLDFGIAKAMAAQGPQLTHATGLMGSPGYMSPEQLQSARDVDLRTDIWALGVTLYQLVSGRMPFAGPTLTEIAVKVATDPPAPLEVGTDPALAAVITRCLAKVPDQRYPSVAALANDLVRFGTSDGRRIASLAAQLTGGATLPTAPPPAIVAAGAPTAASIAASVVPAVHTPRPVTQAGGTAMPVSAAPPRTRWPWIAGGVLLVAATVGITLAVGRGGNATVASPMTPGSGSITTPASDAAVQVVTVVPPVDGGDPWAVRDSGPEPEEDQALEEALEEAYTGLPPDFEQQVANARDQAKQSCKSVVTNAQLAAMPMMQIQIVMCFCVLGDKPNAIKTLARMTDANMRKGAVQICAQYGVSLR